MGEFRHRFRDVDVLVIDDIHFLTERERTPGRVLPHLQQPVPDSTSRSS
jgi:chromosomal replication initiation ATPase DnaA